MDALVYQSGDINTLIKLDAGDSFALMRQRTRINGEKRWT